MENIDETPIYLNIPTSATVRTIGSKKVNIETQKQENWRITIFFTILASREKLASLPIFKVKEEKVTERKLQKRECVEKKKSFCILTKMHGTVKI